MRKLKPDRSITGLIPAFVYLLIFAIVIIWAGYEVGVRVMGVLLLIYAGYSFYVFLLTRNTGYLVAVLYQMFCGLWIGTMPRRFANPLDPLNKTFMILGLAFGAGLWLMLLTRRVKWRGREVLELAAAPVDESADSFTERPRPAGQVDAGRDEIVAFAGFAGSRLIALPYIETERVVLAIVKSGDEYRHTLRRDYMAETWVAIEFNGAVSTHIAQRDYLDYRDTLSFDQLCAALGDLFVDFVALFCRGEGVRIVDRMDALGLSIFS
jgi:hypothetical protein